MSEIPARTAGTGGFCPCCRFCADRGIPHLCVTRGDGDDQRLAAVVAAYGEEVVTPLLEQLAVHPARPLPDVGEGERIVLRAVDRTWCQCGCGAPGSGTPRED